MVSRAYQTGVTFRARPGHYRDIPDEGVHLRGMQTFAFEDEPPILFHSMKISSTTQVDGIDTAGTDVSEGPDGWEVVLKRGEFLTNWRSELATVLERRQNLWTLYAYTPLSAVVVYGGFGGDIRSLWALNAGGSSQLALDEINRMVSFSPRKGRVCFLQGDGKLSSRAEGGEERWVLDVTAKPPVSAFAFSDGSFRFGLWHGKDEILTFSDGSGDYQLLLKGVLESTGNLNRQARLRLQKM